MKKGILILVVLLIVVGIVGVRVYFNSNNNKKVYDANYEKNVKKESYTTEFNETYYAKDIVVPYINIKSEYADKANAEIKEVLDDAIKTYNEGVEDKITYVDVCNYTKYETDKVLSVVLKYGVGATSVVYPKYYIYNINLETNDEMSLKEICTLLGYDYNSLDSKIESGITNELRNIINWNFDDFDTYNNESIEYYRNNTKDKDLRYFINESGKLCIIVTLHTPVESGHQDAIITLNNN